MALSKPYQHQPTAIASYNYTDLADQTGVVKFYGFTKHDGTTKTYGLGINPIYSNDIESTGLRDSIGDFDFDLTAFNNPNTIRGTAVINLCARGTGEAGTTTTTWVHARIRKWDGTTETEIANGRSEGFNATSTTTIKIVNFKVDIPKTQFKKGETLRITIELRFSNSSSDQGGSMAHDPMNRDGTTISPSTDDPTSTTKLEVYIPFDIDL
jgi:predicted acyl esterase